MPLDQPRARPPGFRLQCRPAHITSHVLYASMKQLGALHICQQIHQRKDDDTPGVGKIRLGLVKISASRLLGTSISAAPYAYDVSASAMAAVVARGKEKRVCGWKMVGWCEDGG